jgi:hypothetical protein
MTVAQRAWQLREAARTALVEGRAPDAAELASAAMRMHATPRGRQLHILALVAAGRGREAARAFADAQDRPSP